MPDPGFKHQLLHEQLNVLGNLLKLSAFSSFQQNEAWGRYEEVKCLAHSTCLTNMAALLSITDPKPQSPQTSKILSTVRVLAPWLQTPVNASRKLQGQHLDKQNMV